MPRPTTQPFHPTSPLTSEPVSQPATRSGSMRLRDWPVGRKLTAGFAAMGVLMLAVGGTGVLELGKAQDRLEAMYATSVVSVADLGQAQASFIRVTKDLSGYALAVDDAGRAKAAEAEAADDKALDAEWAAYLRTDPAQTPAQLQSFQGDLTAFRAARDAILPLAASGNYAALATQRAATTVPLDQKVNAELTEMVGRENADARALQVSGAADYHRALILIAALIAVALVAAVVIGTVISRGIAGPLSAVVTVVRGLAEGRLDQRVGLDQRDEIGQVAAALDASTERLGDVMAQVVGSATTLAASSEELTVVATQMSAGGRGVRGAGAGRLGGDGGDHREHRDGRGGRGADERRHPGDLRLHRGRLGCGRHGGGHRRVGGRDADATGGLQRGDRSGRQADHLDRGADEPPGAERDHRGRPGRGGRARVRGGGR